MRILYYSPHPHLALNSQSGYGTHMREMIRAFEEAGHEVLPVIMGGTGERFDSSVPPSGTQRMKEIMKSLVPGAGWETLRDYRLIQRDRAFEGELAVKVRAFQPDLIYERATYLQLSGLRVAQTYDIPHILEVNSPYVEERQTLSGARSLLHSRAAKVEKQQLVQTTKAAIVSATLRDHFAHKHGVKREKFVVVPNAIDPNKATYDQKRVLEITADHNLDGQRVIGFVGSLFRWHGVDLLIQASHRLLQQQYEVKVLIVGDGSIAPELKQLRDELGLQEQIIFTGRVPHADVFNYIEVMDITVLPNSHWYGSPVKLFEYGAMGKPIIAPDNGPVREVMEDGEDGLLVRPEVDELTFALRSLVDDHELRVRLGASFQSKVLSEHTWAQNAARVLQHVSLNPYSV